jgi:DinB superfamily
MSSAHTSVTFPRLTALGEDSRHIAKILMLIALWCAPALAQDANKVSNFVRNACAVRSKESIAAATEMPAGKFGFKPSPQDMTFGQLVLHAAVTNYQYCSKIGGVAVPELPTIADTEPKEKLIERLKSSFDFCTAALAKLDDSTKSEMLTIGDAKTSRAMAILTLTGAWNDHIALETNYLQANGRVPPTAKN